MDLHYLQGQQTQAGVCPCALSPDVLKLPLQRGLASALLCLNPLSIFHGTFPMLARIFIRAYDLEL